MFIILLNNKLLPGGGQDEEGLFAPTTELQDDDIAEQLEVQKN